MKNTGCVKGGSFSLGLMNQIIKVLIVSDLVMVSSYGLIAPIFAVFVVNSVSGGSLAVAGAASAVFLVAKSLFQVPFAILLDRKKGEKDDFWAMLAGSVAFSLMPLFYLVIDNAMQLFAVQFFYGLSAAVTVPAWNAIWIRHIDRGHEAFESSMYFALVGVGSALTASLGGVIAEKFGFSPLFLIVSISSLVGSLFLVMVYRKICKSNINKDQI
jgi:MFS family permease